MARHTIIEAPQREAEVECKPHRAAVPKQKLVCSKCEESLMRKTRKWATESHIDTGKHGSHETAAFSQAERPGRRLSHRQVRNLLLSRSSIQRV